MPSTSPAQARLMAGIAHGMKPYSKNAPSMTVAKKFNQADAKRHMLAKALMKHGR